MRFFFLCHQIRILFYQMVWKFVSKLKYCVPNQIEIKENLWNEEKMIQELHKRSFNSAIRKLLIGNFLWNEEILLLLLSFALINWLQPSLERFLKFSFLFHHLKYFFPQNFKIKIREKRNLNSINFLTGCLQN